MMWSSEQRLFPAYGEFPHRGDVTYIFGVLPCGISPLDYIRLSLRRPLCSGSESLFLYIQSFCSAWCTAPSLLQDTSRTYALACWRSLGIHGGLVLSLCIDGKLPLLSGLQ
jgi:hypothetical protein